MINKKKVVEKTFEEIFEIESEPQNTAKQTFGSLQERLSLCKNCDLRKVDLHQGLKCSLTGNQPDFIEYCPDFKGDIVEPITKKKKSKGFFGSWKGALVMSLLGFVRAASRGFEGFGVVFMVLGIAWLVVALIGNDD